MTATASPGPPPATGSCWSPSRCRRTPCTPNWPGDPAALAAAGISGLYRIGDAVAPRMISEAIFDGHRLAREIDAEDPAQPALYLRELAEPR